MDQSIHLKRVTHFSQDGDVATTNHVQAAFPAPKPARPQPQGLRHRFVPIGVDDGSRGPASQKKATPAASPPQSFQKHIETPATSKKSAKRKHAGDLDESQVTTNHRESPKKEKRKHSPDPDETDASDRAPSTKKNKKRKHRADDETKVRDLNGGEPSAKKAKKTSEPPHVQSIIKPTPVRMTAVPPPIIPGRGVPTPIVPRQSVNGKAKGVQSKYTLPKVASRPSITQPTSGTEVPTPIVPSQRKQTPVPIPPYGRHSAGAAPAATSAIEAKQAKQSKRSKGAKPAQTAQAAETATPAPQRGESSAKECKKQKKEKKEKERKENSGAHASPAYAPMPEMPRPRKATPVPVPRPGAM